MMTMPRLAREPEPGPPTDRSLALAQDLRRFKVGRDVAAERCACACGCGCGCRAEIDVERLHLRTIELYAYLPARAAYPCCLHLSRPESFAAARAALRRGRGIAARDERRLNRDVTI